MVEKERLKTRARQAEGITALMAKNNEKGIGRPKVNIAQAFFTDYKWYKAGEYGNMPAIKFAE
ncbi:MAG: hypothetical protein AB9844_00785 [Clostridiaceae bacterium]